MSYLVYGATGYTGELIARLAVEKGEKPILAGRNEVAVAKLALDLDLPHRAFALDDARALDAGLDGVTAVLHCAGPFSRTSQPMLEACLRKKVHYLDITGEATVFEACAARDAEAKKVGISVMPGVGFDVVPSDCLAAHLKRRLPSATKLALGFQALAGLSHGTATTMLENVGEGGLVRRGGKLERVPAGHRERVIDFGRGPRTAITIPWGDVVTAWYSTKIPDIEVYMAAPSSMRLGMKATRFLAPILSSKPVQELLKKRVPARGPSEEERKSARSYLWGEAEDERGGRVVSRLETPEGYTLTAMTALESARRADAGKTPPGFATPSMAFGPDYITEFDGCRRSDES